MLVAAIVLNDASDDPVDDPIQGSFSPRAEVYFCGDGLAEHGHECLDGCVPSTLDFLLI